MAGEHEHDPASSRAGHRPGQQNPRILDLSRPSPKDWSIQVSDVFFVIVAKDHSGVNSEVKIPPLVLAVEDRQFGQPVALTVLLDGLTIGRRTF
jgi:hypothetical protein